MQVSKGVPTYSVRNALSFYADDRPASDRCPAGGAITDGTRRACFSSFFRIGEFRHLRFFLKREPRGNLT